MVLDYQRQLKKLMRDQETKTDFWHKAVLKEIKNNAIAFKFLEDGQKFPVGSQWIPCHMVFDIHPDFTQKARYIAGGHCTEASTSITYSSVVTRESVRIAFLIAAFSDLDIISADIGNAYLQAPACEKVHTAAGPEFGPNHVGKTVIMYEHYMPSSQVVWHGMQNLVKHYTALVSQPLRQMQMSGSRTLVSRMDLNVMNWY